MKVVMKIVGLKKEERNRQFRGVPVPFFGRINTLHHQRHTYTLAFFGKSVKRVFTDFSKYLILWSFPMCYNWTQTGQKH